MSESFFSSGIPFTQALERSTFVTLSDSQLGVLNGTTNVTAVSPPGHGRAYTVMAITVPNKTGGAIVVNLYLNDGLSGAPTVRLIDTISVANNTTYSSADKFPNGILVRDLQSLELDLDAAGTPTFYATWTVPPHTGQVNPV